MDILERRHVTTDQGTKERDTRTQPCEFLTSLGTIERDTSPRHVTTDPGYNNASI